MLHKWSTWKIASVFFEEPEKKISAAEICRRTSLAHTSVMLHLKELLKEDMICKEITKAGTRSYPIYCANMENSLYKHYKRIYILDQIQHSGLIEFLKDKLMPDCIILFGSTQRGEDTIESDIDLYVQCKEKRIDLSGFEKRLRRSIELHCKEKFEEYPKELRNNIINGILLTGYLVVYR